MLSCMGGLCGGDLCVLGCREIPLLMLGFVLREEVVEVEVVFEVEEEEGR